MNKTKKLSLVLISSSLLYSSCATICGGAKYNANIVVNQKPNAKIYYKGEEVGTGKATVSLKRKEANKFTFSVKDANCEEEKFSFKSRTFRGWAMVGSIFTWTITFNGVPVLPIGLIVDLSNGSLWKPNVYEKNVSKQNYKNYKYAVDYGQKCNPQPTTLTSAGATKTDYVYLKNGQIAKGTIVERAENKSVQIRVANGDVLLYNNEEIEKIEQVITEQK